MADILTGTAGWSYQDWIGSFYPRSQSKTFDWLRFYAENFRIVEVNATYYTYLNPKTVEGWIRKLEDSGDFLFSVKLHQDFTHKKQYNQTKINAVEENLRILSGGERLAGLLIQFPFSFHYSPSNLEYVNRLADIFEGYELFIEFRSNSWKNETVIEFFKNRRLTFCTIDQPEMRNALIFDPVITSKNIYIRFHGRNKDAWLRSIKNFGQEQTYEQQNERYDYLYTPGELINIAEHLKEFFDEVSKVMVIFNNHPHGNAAANSFEMMKMLGEKLKNELPKTILASFPRLTKTAV